MSDPELQRLAKELPDTVLRARADSTTRKYLGAYSRWKAWALKRQDVMPYPINEAHFALYLQHLGETSKSKASVEEAVHAISWVQRSAGDQPVSHCGLVKSTLEGLQRILAKPKKKEPVTPEMLQKLVASIADPPSLSEIRLAPFVS